MQARRNPIRSSTEAQVNNSHHREAAQAEVHPPARIRGAQNPVMIRFGGWRLPRAGRSCGGMPCYTAITVGDDIVESRGARTEANIFDAVELRE